MIKQDAGRARADLKRLSAAADLARGRLDDLLRGPLIDEARARLVAAESALETGRPEFQRSTAIV
ncbi:hypothetical protein [Kineobactrum sediminis]|uniref:hypothetical protein n=1 Tax=Kineobactrum sediminis TaxID=1905677 RepID=UPI0011AF3875|nr:hypothetical protein [Kineobactrum sediminis]